MAGTETFAKFARDTKCGQLAAFGATQGAAIAKAGVEYTLGAALFYHATRNLPEPVPVKGLKARYEGADRGRATERHWLLGAQIAKMDGLAGLVVEVLAEVNSNDVGAMSKRLAGKLQTEAALESVDLTNGKTEALVWSKLDSWIQGGMAVKVKPGIAAEIDKRTEWLGKAVENVTKEHVTGAVPEGEKPEDRAKRLAKAADAKRDAFRNAAEAMKRLIATARQEMLRLQSAADGEGLDAVPDAAEAAARGTVERLAA